MCALSSDPSLPRFIPWLITASFSALLREMFFSLVTPKGGDVAHCLGGGFTTMDVAG